MIHRFFEWLWPPRGPRLSCADCLWWRKRGDGQVICGRSRRHVTLERRGAPSWWLAVRRNQCGYVARWHRDARGYNLAWTRFNRIGWIIQIVGLILVLWVPVFGFALLVFGFTPFITWFWTKWARTEKQFPKLKGW